MESEPFLPPAPPTGSDTEIFSDHQSKTFSHRHLVGATLRNLGNTCFMNSILQCITHTVPLVVKLRSISHNPTCSVSAANEDSEFCSFCALKNHVDECIMMSGSVVSPINFADNLNKISSYFEPGEQQDAHEFLGYLLDSIEKCYVKSNFNDQFPSSSERECPVNQIFRGRLKSQLQCSDCGHCSDTYEHLLDLSLEIEDAESLTDALESFTRKENIDDLDAKFTCEGCNAQVSMEKQLKIDQPPTVIALHLKRFKHSGLFTHKICKFVKYPLELDLRPYMSCPTENSIYDLYSIVVHNGSCYSGHYYCNIRTSHTTWHQMNDSLMCEISESTVLHQEAYILFYIKKGSYPWFARLMDVERISQPILCGSPSCVLDHEDSDHTSSSDGETGCSSPWQIVEKDEGPSPPASAFLVLPTNTELQEDNPASSSSILNSLCDQIIENYPSNISAPEISTAKLKSNHPASPDHWSNIGVSAVSSVAGRFFMQPTEQPISYNHTIDVFTDEPLEDDNENQKVPQNQVDSIKVSKEVGRRIIDLPDAQLLPFRKLVRSMHSSRRSSIMSCLNNVPEPRYKRVLTSKIDCPSKRRQRVVSDLHISGGKGRPHLTSSRAKSFIPQCRKRGFSVDKDHPLGF